MSRSTRSGRLGWAPHRLERRFGVEITELRISEVDYVRETTSVSIRFVGGSRRPASDLFALEEDGPVG